MTSFLVVYLTILSLLIDTVKVGNAVLKVSSNTYLTQQEVYAQTFAALSASTPEIPAEVLLSMAWVESRYYPTAVSRIERGKRRVGIPRWRSPPKGTHSFFCGVTQATAENSWKRCQELQDVPTAYHATVIELERWLSNKVCKHNLHCALTGYSGGFPAIKRGNRYAVFVLKRARLIKMTIH